MGGGTGEVDRRPPLPHIVYQVTVGMIQIDLPNKEAQEASFRCT